MEVEVLEGRELRAGGLAAAALVPAQVAKLPIVPIGGIIVDPLPKADLVLTKLDIQDQGNNQYKVTATLQEGVPPVLVNKAAFTLPGNTIFNSGPAYPGGGVLEILRSTGGTILNAQPPYNPLAVPDPGQVLASIPIPHLDFGQTIQLSTITTGRAVFTGAAVPVPDPVTQLVSPLPEINTANDFKSVSNLVPHTYPVNTLTLGLVPSLRDAMQNAQIRLDSSDSYISIPGVINQHFAIPPKSISIGLGPFSVSVKYYVNNLVSTGVALSYEQGGLALTVKFADNQHALHTPSSLAPDISVKNFQVKIYLPLSYDAADQYFLFGTPNVVSTGDWHANGLLGPVFDLLIPDLNQKVSSAVQGLLSSHLGLVSYQFTKQIHDFLAGGRIVGASIQPDQMILLAETPQ
jgi:hypothetical protein